jgi:hydroxypyruvate reductase
MMSPEADLEGLRRAAREIFFAALEEMDAGRALSERVQLDGYRLKVFDTSYNLEAPGAQVYSVAIGKAARSMAAALDNILGERLSGGVVAAPPEPYANSAQLLQQLISAGQISAEEAEAGIFDEVVRRATEQRGNNTSSNSARLSSRWNIFSGGHPLPNQGSLDGARAAMELLRRADKTGALILFLISGGGSASFELPIDDIVTLEDLREANRVLVSCGATIAEINSVRRAFSAVKGGRLAAFAPHARHVSLIVSDTNPGEGATVASGPTFAPPENAPHALEVVERYQLERRLTPSILRAVTDASIEDESPAAGHDSRHYLLLDNGSAIEAARYEAEARGFITEVAGDIIEQPIGDGCSELLSRVYDGRARNKGEVFCLISGGEFACPLRGDGKGGRNAETVLRAALDLEKRRGTASTAGTSHTVMLSAGTDGIDGNSIAAGAIADETTLERARQRGMEAQLFLERSDAYTFFHNLGDAIVTGPTGTNVRDLRIMIAA